MTRRLSLALLLLVSGLACAEEPPPNEWGVAVLPSGEEISLELAVDPVRRALGYMYREVVGPREGMLFVFESPGRHGIWMKNCKVSLDVIWLDDELRVLEVAAGQEPCPPDRPCPSVAPLRPAHYVLELAAGGAKRHGLRPGAQVVLLTELPPS